MPDRILRSAAIKAAGKRMPFVSDKKLAEQLDLMGADPTEAYRIGAEEAQEEIIRRLAVVKPHPPARSLPPYKDER